VALNCTTDGEHNFANVTWKLPSLENYTQENIRRRVQNCLIKYECSSPDVSCNCCTSN